MIEDWRARLKQAHWEKCDRLAKWLGWNNVQKLVPFTNEKVREALANGDEYLNTLPLASWDRRHGYTPEELQPQVCQCCKQQIAPSLRRDAGMWGLVRRAIQRDKDAGREPLVTSWSLSDTVSVLKHVAREVANAYQAD